MKPANRYFNNDTIIAIATSATSHSAIGIIRISGDKAFAVARNIVAPKSKKIFNDAKQIDAEKIENHKMYRCDFMDEAGRIIDEGVFVWMRAPHSYTGENSVELQMHGNPLVLKTLIATAVKTGLTRVAEAGEFTFRAFRNGKIDLSRAEAVADLISSTSLFSMQTMAAALRGSVESMVVGIKENLMESLAHVELDIDFSDQGVSVLDYTDLKQKLHMVRAKIEEICHNFTKTRPLREGIRTVILGAPNSGKSTLFNRLIGEERSIVSDIKGTTRDVLREAVLLENQMLIFSDTAGIRYADNTIEQEGIRRSMIEVKDATLVLLLLDALDHEQLDRAYVEAFVEKVRRENSQARILVLINKMDKFAEKILSQVEHNLSGFDLIPLSAKTGGGFSELQKALVKIFSLKGIHEDSPQISNIRHREVLEKTSSDLGEAIQKIDKGVNAPDLIAMDIRAALSQIGEITGEVTSDDVLNHIFSKFCIGK